MARRLGFGLSRELWLGPRAALYSAEFFQPDVGDVTAYVPVTHDLSSSGTRSA